VVAAAGVIYDEFGAATGLIGELPVFSWLGHAYRTGSVISSLAYAFQTAKTFASQKGGTASRNNNYTNKKYVPLVKCDDPTLNPRPVCPQPHDVIFNAWYWLKERLKDPARTTSLDTYVFRDSTERKRFVGYLNLGKGPEFYDGPRSEVTYREAQCRDDKPGKLNWEFLHSNALNGSGHYICEMSAVTCRHGNAVPLRTFWEPRVIMWRWSQGLMDDLVATIFHEALHGFWSLVEDERLATRLGCGEERQMTPFLKQFVGQQAPTPQGCAAVSVPIKRNMCGTFEPQ
jgi:hypothetical protein